jgi:hypothetical protein
VHPLGRRGGGITHVPERRIRLLERPQVHGEVIEAVEVSGIGELVVTEPFPHDGQRLHIARVVRLGVRFLTPEVCLHDAAPPHPDVETPAAQVVEHADLLDQPERMMQRQNVHARAEPQAVRALGHRGQEDVLRWGQTVNRRGVVLGQVIGVEAGRVETLDLEEALAIDPIEPEPRHRLDVVEHPEP